MSDRRYHEVRAAQERRAALKAPDATIRAVHLEFALRYDALVEAESGNPARLRHRIDEGALHAVH